MEGIDSLSLATGIIFTAGGIVLMIISFFVWFVIFYAIPILAIGIAILISLRKQEHIEPIKKEKNKKEYQLKRI